VLIGVVALGSDSSKEYDGRAESEGIEGMWKLVSMEDNGEATHDMNGELVFHKGGWTWTTPNSTQKGWYKVDVRERPALLDLKITDPPGTQEPAKSIFRIDGDILKIAYYLEDDRPRDFDTKVDARLHLYIFQRMRK
jgi:uncharacterized protein (TIGR03067 family)